jgi:hypothetical protein
MSISVTQIQSIITTTEAIGGKAPRDITNALARSTKIREAFAALRDDRQDLTRVALAAVDAGRDPASDPEVQRIITATALRDGVPELAANYADADVLHATRDNVDNLIDSWQAPFNEAAEAIATAAKSLGNTDLTNAQGVLHQGGSAAQQWTNATQAVRTITAIVDAWSLLAHQTRFADTSRHYMVMKFTDPTLRQWEEHNLRERKLNAWEAHHLGLALDLATRESYRRRINGLSAQREARENQMSPDRAAVQDWSRKTAVNA